MSPPPEHESTDRLPDEATGLPWPRTWPAVYRLVLMTFVLWVMLLFTLTVSFR